MGSLKRCPANSCCRSSRLCMPQNSWRISCCIANPIHKKVSQNGRTLMMSAPSAHGSFKPAFKPVTITPEELDACSASHPQGSFQQTTAMMEVARSRVDSFDMVGIRDENGTLVAGCFIAYTRGRFGLEGSVWLGPLCDPHDVPSAVKATTGRISHSARRHGARAVTLSAEFGRPSVMTRQGCCPKGEPDAAALGTRP